MEQDFKIICVTNRTLVKGSFVERIKTLASAKPSAIVLREKDLPFIEYSRLAEEVALICKQHEVECVINSFATVAEKLGVTAQVSVDALPLSVSAKFWVSCHSIQEAVNAEKNGACGIIIGHIYETDCKKGLPCRGVDFLRMTVRSVSIPVYAIGGINANNISEIKRTGAKGACVMSGAMLCSDAKNYISSLRNA